MPDLGNATLDAPQTQDHVPAEKVAPEEMQTELQPLSEEAQNALVDCVETQLKAERWARRNEFMEARLQRYYYRGDQNLYYDKAAYQFRPLSESGQEMPSYSDVYNIYRPNLRTLVSVLSQNSPGINFIPNDLRSSADVSSAALAEKLRHRLYRAVDMSVLQTEAARYFCTDSRIVAWTREVQGETAINLFGVLESKVPIYLRGGIKRWPYLGLLEEIDLDAAKDEYPDADIEAQESGTAESNYERYGRLGVLSGTRSQATGDIAKNIVTKCTMWLRPSRYRKIAKQYRDEVEQHFPDGVRVVLCGGVFCEAIAEGMDALAVAFPSPGDGQNRPSLLKDLVPLQDSFNDGMNQVREYFDYGIPATWFDEEAVDAEAINGQRSEPAVMHPATRDKGQPLSDLFWQEAAVTLPPGLMEYLQTIQGSLSQFITGNFPSLYGAEAPSLETMGAYSMSHDSAMGNLAPAWGAMQRLFASITKSGVMVMAQTIGDGEIAIEGQNGTTDSFRASDVLMGEFGCYPDTDSTFPETTASKRAAYTAFVNQIGQVDGGISIIAQPDNLKLGLQLSGLENFVIPGAEARDKQLREIEELLKSGPRAPMGLVTPDGQQGQPEPSVPVDEQYDFHQFEWDKCQQWMSSEERMREERKGNIPGIENVRLHGLAHKAILDKQAAAAATPPPQPAKPPSVSIALKDVKDPNAQAQLLAEVGVQADPEKIEETMGQEAAQSALPHVLTHESAAVSIVHANAGKEKVADDEK